MIKNKNIFKNLTILGLGLCGIAVLSLGVMIPNSVANAMTSNQTSITSDTTLTVTGSGDSVAQSDNISSSDMSSSGVALTVTGDGGGMTQNSSTSSDMSSLSSTKSSEQSSSYMSSSVTNSSMTSSVASSNLSKIDSVIAVIQKAVGSDITVLNKSPKKNFNKDDSLIILREPHSKTVQMVTTKYLVLNSDQMGILNKKLPDMNQMLQDASGSSNLTIGVSCNISYPPFRIRCTINISW